MNSYWNIAIYSALLGFLYLCLPFGLSFSRRDILLAGTIRSHATKDNDSHNFLIEEAVVEEVNNVAAPSKNKFSGLLDFVHVGFPKVR
eukprot:scaffold31070_cov46-Attheya_sp.AAC.4